LAGLPRNRNGDLHVGTYYRRHIAIDAQFDPAETIAPQLVRSASTKKVDIPYPFRDGTQHIGCFSGAFCLAFAFPHGSILLF
jgi:hypothetical protein